jgi:nucleoside-diphosphate-sugar epimerase
VSELLLEQAKGTSVLVTGATGFLGGHLATGLVQRGFKVRALARQTSDLSRLAQAGAEIVVGDLTDAASLERAAAGQRLVFHTAGRVSDWGTRDEFVRANVDGTAAMIAACQTAGVERLVHLSSLTVLGLPRDGRTIDEAADYGAFLPGDFYTETKIGGEKLVRAAHGQKGLVTTVIRPGAIWGPGDTVIMPRVMRLLRRGLMPYIDQGRNLLGLSYVDNLVQGIALAAVTPAAAGQLYHVTDGEEITARVALDELAAALGVSRPKVSLPYWAVYAAAAAVEDTSRALGRSTPPALTRYGVRFVACDCRYDISRARRDLGYSPRVTFHEGAQRLAALPL